MPVHGAQTLKIGTLRAILRDIELSPAKFAELWERQRFGSAPKLGAHGCEVAVEGPDGDFQSAAQGGGYGIDQSDWMVGEARQLCGGLGIVGSFWVEEKCALQHFV